MSRALLFVGIVLAVLFGLAATVGVLAYGNEPPRDGRLEVDGLTEPATIAWSDSGHVWIEADTEAGLAAGLGYLHAADHGWATMLWRQAARGELAAWLGAGARPLDLHARTLGLGDLARQTYASLPEAERALLDAYARGVNRAFEEPGVAQSDAFIVADVVPGPWEPWDALAVERLHLYLGAPALLADASWRVARADSVVGAFATADSTFRARLGAYATGYDRVFVTGEGADRMLVRHIAAGRSALPLFAPVALRLRDVEAVVASVPGSLVTPSGWSGGLGWGLLLGAPV
ncbi:MAG: penicillin acylase family protein, partial [Bacteroidota bacterium]